MYFKLKEQYKKQGVFMRIKEVLDAEIQIVGKVTDVVFDKDTFEITDLVIKKTGFSEQIKASENLVPLELIKVIGDKVLLKGEDDI